MSHGAGKGTVEAIETLVLSSPDHGGIEAHFAPSAGMVCPSLLVGGEQALGVRDGLRAYVGRHSTMGIPLLYPWANRLGAKEFECAGAAVRIDPGSPQVKLDDNGLPIHGLLAAAGGWRVESHEADEGGARLRARFAFDEASGLTGQFPFPHELELGARLGGAELTVATTVRASAGSAVPIAYGFHPYLRLPGLLRDEWEIEVPAAERLLLDARGLPTGERRPADVAPGPLGERGFDDAFTSSGTDPFVLSGGGRRLELALLRGYPFCQLYAPSGQELIAFEPMTAPTNALVTGADLAVLEPGDSRDARFRVTVANWRS